MTRTALGWMFVLAVIWTPSGQAQTYKVLHSFQGNPTDGANSMSGLARDTEGNLYGTTNYGGASNLGVVFKLDKRGTETVLYSFKGGTDGQYPYAGVIRDAEGNLYGTTVSGGASGLGTVFKVDPTGKETVLHSFAGGADGKNPEARLIRDATGNLYGTTAFGGTGTVACNQNCGVVFKLDTTGKETVLYSFTGRADGGVPSGGVIRDAAGNLYGTTSQGGIAQSPAGWGVVFKLDTIGRETVLYTFTGGADGASPAASLIQDSAGNLYGITAQGGTGFGGLGYGVVFKLDRTRTETVLHAFTGGVDGAEPRQSLIHDSAGNLYGATDYGGSGFDRSGYGVVFKLDTTGTETVLYSFTGLADGAEPQAGVIRDAAGNLYGTTWSGGTGNVGVIFKLRP